MKRLQELLAECRESIREVFPWDLIPLLDDDAQKPLLLDVREPTEFENIKITDSINIPRGLLEQACEYGFEETVPELVEARERLVVVICRSGNRSLLAARTMQTMGYQNLASLNTGLRGWNDYDQPLYNSTGLQVDQEDADTFFESNVRPDQLEPDRS